MVILGIESSCDETAAAILKDGDLLSNIVVSQIDIFKSYGGVIPEVAARSHLEAILPVVDKAFTDAGLLKDDKPDWDKIDAIAVTHTPGLLGSLLIGTLTARTLAILHGKPLYAVHHLKSHIYSNWLECPKTPEFPLLSLVISGGHTQIIYMSEHNHFEIIGTTYDDAIGECFDKVAKILGLPYPGGPSVAKAAEKGDAEKYHLPHPKVDGLNFSFSGLKTAVLRAVQKECDVGIDYPSHELKKLLAEQQIYDFAASFQKTAIEILLEKLKLALIEHPDAKSIVFAGGVSANKALREAASGEECISPRPSAGQRAEEEEALARNDGPRELRVAENASDQKRAKWISEEVQDEKSHSKKNVFDGLENTSGHNKTASGEECISPRPSAGQQAEEEEALARNDGPRELRVAENASNQKRADKPQVFFPAPHFSGDNAAMVAMACYYEIQSGVEPIDPYSLDIYPRSEIS